MDSQNGLKLLFFIRFSPSTFPSLNVVAAEICFPQGNSSISKVFCDESSHSIPTSLQNICAISLAFGVLRLLIFFVFLLFFRRTHLVDQMWWLPKPSPIMCAATTVLCTPCSKLNSARRLRARGVIARVTHLTHFCVSRFRCPRIIMAFTLPSCTPLSSRDRYVLGRARISNRRVSFISRFSAGFRCFAWFVRSARVGKTTRYSEPSELLEANLIVNETALVDSILSQVYQRHISFFVSSSD